MAASPLPKSLPRLYLISNRLLFRDEAAFLGALEQALSGGIRLLQLREKDLAAGDLFLLGRKVRTLTRDFGALLLINDRVDLALALDADGVHLTENSLPTHTVRKMLGPECLIGVSTHSAKQIPDLAAQGADFVTFSPIYPTPSKLSYGVPQGLDKLTSACAQSQLPVFALGGITRERSVKCLAAGAFGVAVISGILSAENPASATRSYLDLL